MSIHHYAYAIEPGEAICGEALGDTTSLFAHVSCTLCLRKILPKISEQEKKDILLDSHRNPTCAAYVLADLMKSPQRTVVLYRSSSNIRTGIYLDGLFLFQVDCSADITQLALALGCEVKEEDIRSYHLPEGLFPKNLQTLEEHLQAVKRKACQEGIAYHRKELDKLERELGSVT